MQVLIQIVSGIITFIIFVAAVMNMLEPVFSFLRGDKKNQNPAPVGPNAKRQDSIALDDFLNETAKRPAAMTSQQQPRRQSPQQIRGQSPKSQPAKNPSAKSEQRARKQSSGERRASSPTSRSPGTGVGSHVESFISEHVKSHIGNQIDEAVKSDIHDQVRSHLGERNKSEPTTSHGSAAAADLLTALRSPGGVRQAILMNEILSKPKALRRS